MGVIRLWEHTFHFTFYTDVGNHATALFIKFIIFWLIKQMPVEVMKCNTEISVETEYIYISDVIFVLNQFFFPLQFLTAK